MEPAGRWRAECDPWRHVIADLKREKLSLQRFCHRTGHIFQWQFFCKQLLPSCPCLLRLRKVTGRKSHTQFLSRVCHSRSSTILYVGWYRQVSWFSTCIFHFHFHFPHPFSISIFRFQLFQLPHTHVILEPFNNACKWVKAMIMNSCIHCIIIHTLGTSTSILNCISI